MNAKTNTSFSVIIEGKKRGNASDYWSQKLIPVQSQWDHGSEQEKFEVLCAIRKIYNPDERADIRGKTGQTPSQIGQSEGFTQLLYHHQDAPLAVTVIVKRATGYSRVAPQPDNTARPLLNGEAELQSKSINH